MSKPAESLVGVSVRFLWKRRKGTKSGEMFQVRLGLLPDASSLLLGLLVGLMVKLLPAMYSDLHLVGKRQRRATSSEEIEEAMVHGMFEVPPPDLSNGDPTLYQGLIRALTIEAARSDLAAKSETLQEHCYSSACAIVAGIDTKMERMRRPAVVVADFSRNVRQDVEDEGVRANYYKIQRASNPEGERRNSYESDLHSNHFDNYQTSFDHSSNGGKSKRRRKIPKFANFRQGRKFKASFRSERSALSQERAVGDVIDRNRMDQVENTVYVDQPKRRSRKGRAKVLDRQGPATTMLDSTVQNEGGVLEAINNIGNTFYRVGVAIAFFLL